MGAPSWHFKQDPPRPCSPRELLLAVVAWSIAQCETLGELAAWSAENRDELRAKCRPDDLETIIATLRARQTALRALLHVAESPPFDDMQEPARGQGKDLPIPAAHQSDAPATGGARI